MASTSCSCPRQLGHANPSTTLAVDAHLFDQAEHAHTDEEQSNASYETLTETRDDQRRIGSAMETTVETDVGAEPPGFPAQGSAMLRFWKRARARIAPILAVNM